MRAGRLESKAVPTQMLLSISDLYGVHSAGHVRKLCRNAAVSMGGFPLIAVFGCRVATRPAVFHFLRAGFQHNCFVVRAVVLVVVGFSFSNMA